ncbi:MAG TPA: leucine--tRNA ligase [Candidatus Rifleibacterium sp.]|nr:leucine--tRNA ligase [Candidatus Rifleibacterium sp.]HPT46518.1 leucine--tRNA ligase [Candidatus Rifleibacterium sp.]
MAEKFDSQAVQAKWQPKWREMGLYKTSEDRNRPKFYCLDFFPYPSGNGLSVGHLRNYVPTDVISRMKRMQGFNVLHPMGWDAFGLPAENFAIKMGVHPAKTTEKNAGNYRRQLTLVECGYDWEREINSTDPDYYRWTQWFFLLLYKRGLAYKATGAQWWCPECRTILANEQVEQGLCWRCESQVEKKDLNQWFFKITDYADRLIDDLKTVDWPDRIKKMQENWIGKSKGAEVNFKGINPVSGEEYDIPIFTTRVDTIFGVTFMTLAPEHPLVEKLTNPANRAAVETYISDSRKKSEIDRLSTEKEKTGVNLGSFAINPFNGEKVPVFIGDYVLYGYGTGAVMAVPAHDERDFAFAKKYNLPVKEVITPAGKPQGELKAAFTEYGTLINSAQFNALTSEQAIDRMIAWLGDKKLGSGRINYKLRDWLISRQRYWGAPVPIVHCDCCGEVPVPDDQLPVKLPDISEFKPGADGKSPLAFITDWVKTTCPKCGKPARRETDTMDGFACSSWYFLRFISPKLKTSPFDADAIKFWAPVDLYVGGAEHAVMHLLYARFWTKVMYDAGLVPFIEPFTKLRNQGMMLAADGTKMSKSKNNVITPDEIVDKYGADTLRAFILFLGTFELEVSWSDEGVRGMNRFINRVFDMISENPGGTTKAEGKEAEDLNRIMHRTIKAVSNDIENFSFNTAIARLMELTNAMGEAIKKTNLPSTTLWREVVENMLKLMATITPFLAEELWETIGCKGSVHQQKWPAWDEKALVESTVTLPVQINGKLRDQIELPADIDEVGARKAAEASEKVQKYLEGTQIIKFIYVPKRMISFVVK